MKRHCNKHGWCMTPKSVANDVAAVAAAAFVPTVEQSVADGWKLMESTPLVLDGVIVGGGAH